MSQLAPRLFFSGFVLVLVSILLFVLTRAVPGSPSVIVLGLDSTPQQHIAFDREHGLDLPLPEQYVAWLGKTLSGDLGKSYMTGRPLGEELARTFPITLELVVLSIAFAVIAGVSLGIVSAIMAGRLPDVIASLFSVVGVSVPGFWLGLILIVYLSVALGWFPPGGFVPLSEGVWANLYAMVLPAFTLSLHYIASLSRLTRSSMLDALSQDYVRTARAMGLSRPLILAYAFKNAAAPVVAISAIAFGYAFGWALIIEHVFSIPGMSRSLLNAIRERDYPMIQIVVLVVTTVFIVSNLAADIVNRVINPKLQ